jgi:hypothetical protein
MASFDDQRRDGGPRKLIDKRPAQCLSSRRDSHAVPIGYKDDWPLRAAWMASVVKCAVL